MGKTIRVLHVIGSMNRGGAETMIMNLYRRIDREKVQFDFVENEGGTAAFDEEILSLGGRIYHCPRFEGKNYFNYRCWWKQFFVARSGEYAIVHGHIGSTAAIYLAEAKKAGCFTIAHSHNTRTQWNAHEALYAAVSWPTRFIAECFFSCSHAAAASRFGAKIDRDAERCFMLPNAIELAQFAFRPEVRDELKRELHLEEKTVIGHVGRFNEQKNHVFLIEIFHRIHLLNPDTVLLLVGDGNLRPEITKLVSEKGLADAVIFAGVRSDVYRYYQVMDVMVFPSLFEGLPVTMVEAQASALPCLISNFVPPECILTNGLVEIMNLQEPTDLWAKKALQMAQMPRVDHTEEIREKGFSIEDTSKWLEAFYLEKAK